MVYITLVCAAGMSTSLLVSKMREVAKKENIDAEIIAMSESAFLRYKKPTDVLLLGPQIRGLLDEMKQKFEPKGIKVGVVDMQDYGLMNGKKVLNAALKLLEL